MKILAFTKMSELPPAMLELAKAIGGAECEKDSSYDQVLRAIRRHSPSLVLIDGEFGVSDASRWKELGEFSTNELNRQLTTLPHNKLPESFVLLHHVRFHMRASPLKQIIVFMNNPSREIVEVLQYYGASTVIPSLDKLSGNSQAIIKMINGGKSALSGLKELWGKATA